MVSIIHSVSGITLYSQVFDSFCKKFDENFDYEIIGSFISAIKVFSHEFGQDEIKQIEMSTLKFLMYEKKDLIIFFLLDANDQNDSYKKSLIITLNTFLKLFSEEISKNYNQINLFYKFTPILREILRIPPEKIEVSCLNCPFGQKENCLFWQVREKIAKMRKRNI